MGKAILVLVIICLMASLLSKTEGGRDAPNEERGGEVYNPQLLLGHGGIGGPGGLWPWGIGGPGGLWPWGGGGGPVGLWPWGGGGPGGLWPWGGGGHGGGPGKFWPWGGGGGGPGKFWPWGGDGGGPGGPKSLWPWGGGGWSHGGWKKVQDNPQLKDFGENAGTDNGGNTAASMGNP